MNRARTFYMTLRRREVKVVMIRILASTSEVSGLACKDKTALS